MSIFCLGVSSLIALESPQMIVIKLGQIFPFFGTYVNCRLDAHCVTIALHSLEMKS